MRLLPFVLLASLALGCDSDTVAPGLEEVAAETERINAWFEAQFEEQLASSPIQQTLLGRKSNNDRIDDMSIEAQDAQLASLRASVAEMQEEFDFDLLTPEAKTSWEVWEYGLAQQEAFAPSMTPCWEAGRCPSPFWRRGWIGGSRAGAGPLNSPGVYSLTVTRFDRVTYGTSSSS